jgi:hypothetical protein
MERRSGFAVWELVWIALCLVILAVGFLIPHYISAQRAAKLTQCTANLKQVAFGYFSWAHDSEEGELPLWLSKTRGGTLEYGDTGEVFRHFQVLTNVIPNPKCLVCPAVNERKPGTNWYSNFQNVNLSYFVNLAPRPIVPDWLDIIPTQILFGDRNITGGTLTNHLMLVNSNSPITWTSDLHKKRGNVVIIDGSVRTWGTNDWAKYLEHRAPFRIAIP